jgi:hypothetical protein
MAAPKVGVRGRIATFDPGAVMRKVTVPEGRSGIVRFRPWSVVLRVDCRKSVWASRQRLSASSRGAVHNTPLIILSCTADREGWQIAA